eukprot:TRINITY_DN3255_c0_g1_i1.p1 TRINITY_DN3255_c0_g1~~TRINITY_DN3255_c0_g1_i1.p1  ORF type:complete len:648 (+),score=232.26 TRINITY_DN3255_c0_g1_i1:54-1997(+)
MSKEKKKCKKCGSTETAKDPETATTVCVGCGMVITEAEIVFTNTFSEVGGSVQADGMYVAANGGVRGEGYSRPSREISMERAKDVMTQIGSHLHLAPFMIDQAVQFYGLSLLHRFPTGRRSQHVYGACLYAVCRRTKTPHMLIDFADAIRCNVYKIARTYKDLCLLLGLEVSYIDPCWFIRRFARELKDIYKNSQTEINDSNPEQDPKPTELYNNDEEMERLITSANRFVQRFQRDWITTGRWPTGISASALLAAGKFLGIDIDITDVVKVARIGESTIVKRINELQSTLVSRLTPEEFDMGIEVENQADPPCYTEGLRKGPRDQKLREERQKLEREIQRLKKEKLRRKAAINNSKNNTNNNNKNNKSSTPSIPSSPAIPSSLGSTSTQAINENDEINPENVEETALKMTCMLKNNFGNQNTIKDLLSQYEKAIEKEYEKPEGPAEYITKEVEVIEGDELSSKTIWKDGEPFYWELFCYDDGNLDELNEAELDEYLAPQKEVEKVQKWWEANNKDYELLMKEKAEYEAKGIDYNKLKRQKTSKKTARTAEEATGDMLAKKGMSTLVNYDYLASQKDGEEGEEGAGEVGGGGRRGRKRRRGRDDDGGGSNLNEVGGGGGNGAVGGEYEDPFADYGFGEDFGGGGEEFW